MNFSDFCFTQKSCKFEGLECSWKMNIYFGWFLFAGKKTLFSHLRVWGDCLSTNWVVGFFLRIYDTVIQIVLQDDVL